MPRYDPLSKTERSERMSRVRNRDTKPETIVRRTLFGLGYRFRLKQKGVPGNPDIVFKGRRKAIFVHGCFWHQHGCSIYRMPKTRRSFWEPKLEGNVERDKRNLGRLQRDGWKVLVVWECQLQKRNLDKFARRLKKFMES
jgi:DNA mismatch endonuclease (patch repair protein)